MSLHVHCVHPTWLLAAFMVCGMANRADEILTHPNDVTVEEGAAAEFSCTASRSPDEHVSPLLIVWKLNNSFLDPTRSYISTEFRELPDGSVATATLRIEPTDRSRDSGLYRCTALSSGVGVDSDQAHLTFVKGFVTDSPDPFVEVPADATVQAGRTATLRCQPPTSMALSAVTWEKDGQVVRSEGRIRISVRAKVHRLRIKNVQETDVASYVCVAGTRRSRAARLIIQEEQTKAPSGSLTVHPSGAVAKRGDSVTFQCSSDRSQRVEWFKGDKKLYSRSAAKISVSQSGQLKFKHVLTRHKGDYTCKAVGSSETVTVRLDIAFIDQLPPDGGGIESVVWGSSVEFQCPLPLGYPVPNITWYFGGREIRNDGVKYWSYPGGLFVDQVTDEDAGFYHCVASNLAGNTNITWKVTIDHSAAPTTNSLTIITPSEHISLFLHEPYNVSVRLFDVVRWDCQLRFHVDFTTYWWVHETKIFSNDATGRVVTYPNGSIVINAIRKDDIGQWTCVAGFDGRFKLKDIPTSAFIHIVEPTGIVPLRFDHEGRPPPILDIGVGQSHSLPCNAWTAYPPLTITWTKDDIILQRISAFSNRGSNQLTISRTDKSDSGSYFCEIRDQTNTTLLAEMRITVMSPPVVRVLPESVAVNQQEEIRLSCEVVSGDGDIAVSWRARGWPGLPQSTAQRFDENDNGTLVIRNAKSFDANTYFCVASNPGGEGTASANVTVNMVLDVENQVGGESSNSVPIAPIIAVCGVLYVALMVALGVWCYKRRPYSRGQKKPAQRNDLEAHATTDDIPDTMEIVRSTLERGTESTVGSGQYWTVYKAELKNQCSKGGETMVTSVLVKELHEEGFNRDRLMKEVRATKRLHHDNVLALMGVCSDQQPYLVVTENLDQGDLKKYLTDLRLSDGSLTSSKQLSFLRQIADGLEYLSAQGHIHKDVAARNCLISRDLLVKLSDLSLCVDGYEDDYVSETTAVAKHYRPLRWMSPEAITTYLLTTENDIWSYGVLMWEVATLARWPYEEMSNIEVVAAVQQGHRLDQPSNCPNDLYEIMQNCWHKVPRDRPAFESISELLHRLP